MKHIDAMVSNLKRKAICEAIIKAGAGGVTISETRGKGTGISPKAVSYDTDITIHACGCQQSKNKPMFDGTHKTIT